MSFASIAIKTSIPVTAPAATSGALTFITIEDENWLQITGDASAGSGSLYVLRWNADLAEWRPYMEDKPIAVNSAALNGLFSAYYPFPKGEESFVLYDPAAAITATASAARTGSPLAAPTPASSGASGGATEAKQDAGNASLVSILGQLDNKTSTLATALAQTTSNNSLSSIDGKVATAAKQDTGNTSLSSIDSKVATAAKQDTGNTSLATIATQQTDGSQKAAVTQSTGSGSAATFWYTRNTDGTNTQPTMDTAARSGYQRITDGTNTAAVKASATPAATTDPAAAVALSPNAPGLTVTMSSKSSSNASATMLASNSARKGATFYNDDANPLYLRTDGSAATTSIGGYTVKIASGAYYELPVGANGGVYQGAITGIWTAAGSSGVSISEST